MGVTVMELGNTSGAISSGVPGCSAYQTVRARSSVITAALIAAVNTPWFFNSTAGESPI